MKAKATLKQIAKDLHVSVSTVSKALNDSSEISAQTKQKIQEYAKLKNYKPNVIGLNLKNRKTKTIGVVIPNILNPFFAKVFSGIEKVCDAHGYNVLTCISNESIQKETHVLDILSNGTIDGFILAMSEQAQKEGEYGHFKQIIAEGTPIVMFDRFTEEIDCDKVIVDDYEAALNAVAHFVKTGCKRIALVTAESNLSVMKIRAKGYRDAMDKAGLQADDSLEILCSNEQEFDLRIAEMLDKVRPDAIFALDEHASVTTMKQALQRGYRIPEELSVIGFADGLWSRRMTPSLATISQHGPQIGEAATQLLIERLTSTEEYLPYQTKVISTELRKRDSVKKI